MGTVGIIFSYMAIFLAGGCLGMNITFAIYDKHMRKILYYMMDKEYEKDNGQER